MVSPKLSDEFNQRKTEGTLTDLKENPMQQVREDVVDQIGSLIQSGLLQVDTIDVDGGFCYGLTEEGYKTAKQIEESKESEKDG